MIKAYCRYISVYFVVALAGQFGGHVSVKVPQSNLKYFVFSMESVIKSLRVLPSLHDRLQNQSNSLEIY